MLGWDLFALVGSWLSGPGLSKPTDFVGGTFTLNLPLSRLCLSNPTDFVGGSFKSDLLKTGG